ncbi:hypothetical protein [Actinomadura luteofluorescens]|uniref:hypothetical protein n=1 Tax=Actinomadura luteofluorescens TaxID=46163 RepID=UPI0030D1ED8A
MNSTSSTPLPAVLPAPRRLLGAGALKCCPTCRTPLDGGPVRFRCEPCGRSVMAADLDTEYHHGPVPNPARTGNDHDGRDRR